MPKRGARALPAGGDRAEPIVTYSRIIDDVAPVDDGRVEPHLTAVRVDRPGRRKGAEPHIEDIDRLPLVDAPPSHASIDPMGDLTAGEIRQVRRRGPRALLLAGAICVLAGAGVLAAVFNGIANQNGQTTTVAAAPEAPGPLVLPESIDATGRSVRVVSADQIPPASDSTALAPRAVADPVAGEAALSDQATVSGEAALSAEPPGRVIFDPPAPRLRPVTASFNPPQLTPANDPMATAAIAPAPRPLAPAPAPLAPPPAPLAAAPAPAPGGVDAALANVDRILGERAATNAPQPLGSGDGEYYGPVAPAGQAQPLPYPVMQPLQNGQQAYPAPQGTAYPPGTTFASDGTPLGPDGYPVQDYPQQPMDPNVDLAASEQDSPWWLPKRRAVTVQNAPVPPASIPSAPTTYGTW